MANTTKSGDFSYVLNPKAGTVLTATEGGQAEAEFDFYNDSPDVASFFLEVINLPEGWFSGTGEEFAAYAAASGGGQLRLTLTPQIGAASGDYGFTVRTKSGGATIGVDVPLVLRVNGLSRETRPKAVIRNIAEAQTAHETIQDSAVTQVSDPNLESPIAGQTESKTAEKRAAARATVKKTSKPAPVVPLADPPLIYPTETAIESDTAADFSEIQDSPPATVQDEPILIDYSAYGQPTENPSSFDDEPVIDEPFLLDPKDSTVVSLRPGDACLLRFPFTNSGSRETTYIIDEDRSLEDGWLVLVQDQVNLARNGSGELKIRISPPVNAEPADYPFNVTLGPQGGTLTSRSFTLSVLATPAVSISTKAQTVSIGPLASEIIFPLVVESIGNADTAFRIAVKMPESQNSSEESQSVTGDIYEVDRWRYIFDKEMETLRSPATGRNPRPVPINLRVKPKGIWWFGIKQVNSLTVAAVPVTDILNSGKPGNRIELTAVRRRYLPFPALFLIPIITAILLFFSGSPQNLTVTNAQYTQAAAEGNSAADYWIVNPSGDQPKTANLSWESRPGAMLRVTASPLGQESAPALNIVKLGSGELNDTQSVSSQNRKLDYHYRVSRFIGGGDTDAFVHFIYTSPLTPLKVGGGLMRQGVVNLSVPSQTNGYARLSFKNTATSLYRLNWWLAKAASAQGYQVLDLRGEGSLEPGQTEVFKIAHSDNADPDQMVFVTSDAAHPVVTVNLHPVP